MLIYYFFLISINYYIISIANNTRLKLKLHHNRYRIQRFNCVNAKQTTIKMFNINLLTYAVLVIKINKGAWTLKASSYLPIQINLNFFGWVYTQSYFSGPSCWYHWNIYQIEGAVTEPAVLSKPQKTGIALMTLLLP